MTQNTPYEKVRVVALLALIGFLWFVFNDTITDPSQIKLIYEDF
jgi:hypothetical protein